MEIKNTNESEQNTERKKFSELSEEEKKLWEVDEELLNEPLDEASTGRVTVMGAEVVYSEGYVRPYNPLNRPQIHYKNFIISVLIYALGLSSALILGGMYFEPYKAYVAWGFTLVYGLIIGKRAVIWLVHFYQSKASDDTRLRCRFEPSCSEYMIKSVNKYGFIKGTTKGICRVLRCRAPNGGIDYP